MNPKDLLNTYIKNPSLLNHCQMVSKAMKASAEKLGLDETEVKKWEICGLLHDLDWEMYPSLHPLKAVNEILPNEGIDIEIIEAIKSHAPLRTERLPKTLMEKHLFALDELSGFLFAVSKIRPNGFLDLEVSSVIKKLKTPKFAENVNREDIYEGVRLLETTLEDLIKFLIEVFRK